MTLVAPSGRSGSRLVTTVLAFGGLSMIGVGAWCRLDPSGFAHWADWPEHEHFLHDAGVFQIGIGLIMICALWWRDVVAVALVGFVFTNAIHGLNHYLDRHDGGHPSDAVLFLTLAALGIAAMAVHLRRKRANEQQT
ncbi:hypothetical protein ACQHIV_03825 [Kribbella sp. GL6]|uniref:hypothetical protein n=1 Tax=Kribbella sp. GL6 TaxID=3419765 RepID=UPI003CFE309E